MADTLDLVGELFSYLTLRSVLIFVTVFLGTYISTHGRREKRRNLPPGPWGLPVLGCLPFLGSKAHVVLTNWSKKYGDVFLVNFGMVPVVVLNGFDTIRDALVKQGAEFAGRPDLFTFRTPPHIPLTYKGILIETYSQQLIERRRFSLRVLRDLGVGKVNLESTIINAELKELHEALALTNGTPTDVFPMLRDAIANVTFGITFGSRFQHNDPEFRGILDTVNQNFELNQKLALNNFVPFLQNFPSPSLRQYQRNQEYLVGLLLKWNAEQKQKYNPKETKSFVDAYRHEVVKHEARSEETAGGGVKMVGPPTNPETIFTENQITSVTIDLFFAGGETVTTTLRWGLLYMALYPDVQRKVQQEIRSVLGEDEQPSITHKTSLPYTEATIMEIQRLNYIVPLGVPHCTTSDVSFHGYSIPRDTMVIVNMWSVMMDPSRWPEPEIFDPRRHIDQNGRIVKKDDFIPFSMGKRTCLGEQLGKMELFLFFTSLMQRFSFHLPENTPPPKLEGKLGSTYVPPDYELCVTLLPSTG
ncbi:cytochrome P450 2J2 [Lingula anatina]|uniref:Cytochrome P450 2J2 n=1 Tax=Lingula anatina TaxID=7574 RepID=A0A1S3I4N9_LINAN|nr:cytochrome P450 2J2 [Lingula anatina]|eukprot:XP_013393232.1 cytochrome P450 2J2 [Lingula anatina]